MRRSPFISLTAAICLSSAHAQDSTTAAKKATPAKAQCTIVQETADWVKGQRALLADSPTKWTSDSMRTVIKNAIGVQWTDVPGLQLGWALADTIPPARDSAATALAAQMRRLPRGSPFPSRTTVGVAGMRGLFVLASGDTGFMRTALRRVMEAGPDEGIKPDIAVMEDRVRLNSGRKQLYGTQLHIVGGTIVPFAIEDSAHADLRREVASLPPLSWSLCNATAKSPK